ncbi:MAG: c-type cytochrome [Candidatus Aminicenantales bacterium]
MSVFLLKSILGIAFMAAALTALLSMLTLMGKSEKKTSPKALRRIHKTSGFIFLLLLLLISSLCLKFWIRIGDLASFRAVFHAVLSLILIVIFLLKVVIVQFYKTFLRFAPALGMTVFCTAFLVFATSGGYYLLRTAFPVSLENPREEALSLTGNSENGAAIFLARCSSCHYADRNDTRIGPGLKNLLKKEKLPNSGRPATVGNVRAQLINPLAAMPSFKDLQGQELADLIEYLKTL